MRGGRAVAVGILVIGLVAAGRPAAAAERVTIAVGGFGNIAFLPYEVARALGYFTEQGLDVEFQYFKSGIQAATAVLTGNVEFAGAGFSETIKAALQGRSLKMIAVFHDVPGMQLLVRASDRETVRTVGDLRGRPIGVTGLGSATHLILTYILKRAGLRPEEISAVPVGFEGLAAALENGRVEALMTGGAPAVKLVEAGRAFVLVDFAAPGRAEAFFGGPYIDTGVLTRPEIVAGRPEVCRKVVRAVVQANRWIAEHTAVQVVAVLPDTIAPDRPLYVKALESVRGGLSKNGRVNPHGVETVLSAHREFGLIPADRHVDPLSLYDNTFVDQVLAGGS